MKFQTTQEDALAIKDKLQAERDKVRAEVVTKTKHDVVKFWYGGKLIFWFGIRRGSKELPHPHIHLQMFLSQKECRLFRICDISVLQYIEILKAKGIIAK